MLGKYSFEHGQGFGLEKSNKKKFIVPMSDEPGEYENEKLIKLLKNYFDKSNYSSDRIKNVLLPALLSKKVLTRNELKKEFVKTTLLPQCQIGKISCYQK